MANMDIDTIITDLNRRFSAPLPEFYKRRIIFWYDEDREFEDQIDNLELDCAKIAKLTGSNAFTVKKLLTVDDAYSNYLVYSPLRYDRDDDNWMINLELMSEEFRADLHSIWMDEMGLLPNPILRGQVKAYRKFFNAKERRKAVAAMAGGIATAGQMHIAVMSAICGLKNSSATDILKAVLSDNLDMEENGIYQSFVNYGADRAFWALCAKLTGYHEGEKSNLKRLAVQILLTAATRTMHQEHLMGLNALISTPHQSNCYDFVSQWLHSDDKDSLYEIARFVEKTAHLNERFLKLSVEDLQDTEVFPCIHELILLQLMQEIGHQNIRVEGITSTVAKRRPMVWFEENRCFYEGLQQAANMQSFVLSHHDGFHDVEPAKIWKEYTMDYYKMDSYYRQFHLAFGQSLTAAHALLDDPFKHVAQIVEGLYAHWFLGNLGKNWSDASAEQLETYGKILDIPQQADFYKTKIADSDSRMYVIISDALRYEVAAGLADVLKKEMQGKVELSSMEAIFPTVTKFGMAALLPHKKLEVVEKPNGLAMLADGMSTDAGQREKVLKAANPQSCAIRYSNYMAATRAERQAMIKGMDVVYIYHDKVDEASHVSDSAVFPACEEAIVQIKNLIKQIVNDSGSGNIIVTADHGFLYTYRALTEDDKVDKTSESEQDVEVDRRYLITRKGAQPAYLQKVKYTEQYDAFAPRENIRIKKKGGGLNFVHGGISLQEMVVPVVEYRHLRNDNKTYLRNKEKYDTRPVSLSLLSSGRKIFNMIFALDFYQKESVCDNREEASFQCYFVDAAGNPVSDTVRIIANKESDNAQERVFRCSFNLKPLKFSNRDSYYLIIADEKGVQAPQKEEFQIDIAFAFDEFYF